MSILCKCNKIGNMSYAKIHCVKSFSHIPSWFNPYMIPTFNDIKKKPVKNIVGTGENAGYQHFLLFP